jgi:hypothetical protein
MEKKYNNSHNEFSNMEGYKADGIVEKYQPMGDGLKPANEMEIVDLADENQVQDMIDYLSKIGKDPDVKKLQQAKSPNLSVAQKLEMFKEDPAGTYIVKNGKRISIAQFMKNKNSLNTRNNFNFQKDKKDPRFADGNPNAKEIPPGDYNSMVFNQKKVK